jgi:RimJ/RimL family protein N-acetyltransferase
MIINHTVEMHKLTGPHVTLRKPMASDAVWRLALGQDPSIATMFGQSKASMKPLSQNDADAWARELVNHSHAWIIEVNGTGVGEVRLDRVDMTDRRASYAIGIYDPAMLGKGIGTEATLLVLQHAFQDLELHRVGLRVVAFNERAIRSYQKCGFQIEGRERESCLVDGKRYDDVMMGLLVSEFKVPFVER